MVTQQTIAHLIANSLEAQGIAVKTNLKGDRLRVMLESSQVPNQ
jgi:adenylylsulfate kinase-like enzyme